MTEERAVRFLVALGQTLSAMRLYAEGHPARASALEEAHGRLREVLDHVEGPTFNFLDGEVVFGDERLRGLEDWPWASSLSGAGIERIEFARGVPLDELRRFCLELERRLEGPSPPPKRIEESWFRHIRFGTLARIASEEEADAVRAELENELPSVEEIFHVARSKGEVPLEVSRSVVESIDEAIRNSPDLLRLLLPLEDHEQYMTIHSMNTSVLSIGLAEVVGYAGPDARQVGEAALLHNVGTSALPEELLHKPEPLEGEELDLFREHSVEGARILLRSRESVRLSAVVAYEHHWTWDGGGYPVRRYERDPHPVSQLVQISEVYDALRSERPFRGAWPADEILAHLEEEAGTTFNPETVRAFLAMLERRQEKEPTEEGHGKGEDDAGVGGP